MFFADDRYTTALKRNGDDTASRNLGAMIDQIEGFKNFPPNVAKLDPNQSASQLIHSPAPKDDEHLPNLLMYFPPPLSLFIYYSIGSHNHSGNISLQNDDENDPNSKSQVETRLFNSGSYVPEDYDDNPNFYNKTGSMDKQKEFEFIRKIIRELINYWDDEEQSFGKSKKANDGNVRIRMGNVDEKPLRVTTIESDEMKPDDGKPSFNTFLEWLFKNGHINSTQLSDLSSRRRKPLVDEESEKLNFNPLKFEDKKNTTSGKIRILVDIDKNPEIMKNLFSRNNTRNQNESQPYQVIVNLNEYVDPQEEDLVSRRLISMASKQLHQNVTGNQKMPKVLWVFPVYGNEENETIINEIKKRSKEKINTLEDVDAPTEHADNNGGSYYMPKNSDANSGNDNVDRAKYVDNYNSSTTNYSKKDTEDEYYDDDQEMYDEDEYEQSESIENGSSQK